MKMKISEVLIYYDTELVVELTDEQGAIYIGLLAKQESKGSTYTAVAASVEDRRSLYQGDVDLKEFLLSVSPLTRIYSLFVDTDDFSQWFDAAAVASDKLFEVMPEPGYFIGRPAVAASQGPRI